MALKLKASPVEIWKAIPGCEGYEISNQGRIKSLKRKKVLETRILKKSSIVCLSQIFPLPLRNGSTKMCSRRKVFRVSRLVAEAFPELPKQENAPRKRKVPPQVEEIRAKLAQGIKPKQIAADLGVSQATISRIRRGRTWANPGEVVPTIS
jgi:hypothetical protein